MRRKRKMQIGIDSFAARFDDAGLAVSTATRMRELLERIEHADQVGLDVFGIGEHHKREFLDSAPPVILAAAAARTRRIRLTSAVAVLSAADAAAPTSELVGRWWYAALVCARWAPWAAIDGRNHRW